jgi:hypothetical protein
VPRIPTHADHPHRARSSSVVGRRRVDEVGFVRRRTRVGASGSRRWARILSIPCRLRMTATGTSLPVQREGQASTSTRKQSSPSRSSRAANKEVVPK